MNAGDGPGWDARVAAFTARVYTCHRCGRAGEQTRTTDPHPAAHRFSLPGGVLVLPRCEHCTPATDDDPADLADEAHAERALHRAFVRSGPTVQAVPLNAYRCSVAACARIWHELIARPPAVPVFDPVEGIPRHPCPWCLVEWPETSRRDHLALADALQPPPGR